MALLRLHRTTSQATDKDLEELYAMLVSHAMRYMDDFDEVLDVVQESLVQTLERVSEGKSIQYFKAYCFKVLRTQIETKSLQKSREIASEKIQEVPTCPGGDDFMLRECLELLPEKERKAVRLHDIEGVELEEVARRMHLSESYVTKLLSNGHTLMKQILKKGYYNG